MSVQTRTTGLQNEIVRLYCRFIKDGVLTNPATQPIVEILDTDGVTVLGTIPAQLENTGVWYADWFVPAHLPLGNYYDQWSFQWSASSEVTEITMIFEVHSLENYINFLSKGISYSISNRGLQLMNDLMNDFIYEAMHIPVYWEQGMRIQQDAQKKRTKNYYYFVLNNPYFEATAGDVYTVGGQNYTVFTTISLESSSSSSTAAEETSSVTISLSSMSSSTQTSESSSSTQSSSLSSETANSSSSSSEGPQPESEVSSEYIHETILTCVGLVNPPTSGTLTLVSGGGTASVGYTSWSVKTSKFSTVYSLAYGNWNMEPRPIVRDNTRIVDDGWHADYDGKIYFDGLRAPEDSPNVSYNFAYFSKEELLSFLNLGLKFMNSIPPASTTYSSLEASPPDWDPGILLMAAITALKRLIFGLNWQEKMIIFGDPESARNAQQMFQSLYQSYSELWTEFGKNVKTLKLPGIALSVTPEYSLPGGRCMSSDTYITSEVDGEIKERTIKVLCNLFDLGKKIRVMSMVNNGIDLTDVSKIWKSGIKNTYLVKTNSHTIRLTKEHLIYIPTTMEYVPVMNLGKKSYNTLMVMNNSRLEEQTIISIPELFKEEEVYDIEIPSTQNVIANNIVSHNSRWFRYMYKSSAGS